MSLYTSKKRQIKDLKNALRIEKRFFELALGSAQALEKEVTRLRSKVNLYQHMETFDASLKKNKAKIKKDFPEKYPNTTTRGNTAVWTKNPRNFDIPWTD